MIRVFPCRSLAKLTWPLAFVAGCAAQEGIVGAETGFFTNFADDSDAFWQVQVPLEGAQVEFGVDAEGASDNQVVELRFPGHPEFAPTDNVGARFATQIASSEQFHFGTFRSRVQFGSCATTEGTVGAAFAYFSDGTDDNGNSLVDDQEINFQILCGQASYAYLTVFTDYQETGGDVQFRKLSRLIDFSSGDIYDTPQPDDDAFVLTGNDPVFAQPSFFSAATFYELGFEWHSDSLRFFLKMGGSERTLWTLTDAARIPQRPVQAMYNMWHTDQRWFPETGVANFPAQDVVMRLDWFEYVPEEGSE